MMNSWIEAICPECGRTNWLDNGDPADMTGFDVDGFVCWNCGKSFTMEEEESDEDFLEGDVLPHLTKKKLDELDKKLKTFILLTICGVKG